MDFNTYEKMYNDSITNPSEFWTKQADRLDWDKKWDKVKNTSYEKNNVFVKWFEGAKLNVSVNCIDRHLPTKANDIAFYWEPDHPDSAARAITYQELYNEVFYSQITCILAKVTFKY